MAPRKGRARTLAEVRSELEGIDRSLLRLVAERIRVAREAIELRRREGGGLTDAAQERHVLRRARGWALELELPPTIAVEFIARLIAAGKGEGHPLAPRASRRPSPRTSPSSIASPIGPTFHRTFPRLESIGVAEPGSADPPARGRLDAG